MSEYEYPFEEQQWVFSCIEEFIETETLNKMTEHALWRAENIYQRLVDAKYEPDLDYIQEKEILLYYILAYHASCTYTDKFWRHHQINGWMIDDDKGLETIMEAPDFWCKPRMSRKKDLESLDEHIRRYYVNEYRTDK